MVNFGQSLFVSAFLSRAGQGNYPSGLPKYGGDGAYATLFVSALALA